MTTKYWTKKKSVKLFACVQLYWLPVRTGSELNNHGLKKEKGLIETDFQLKETDKQKKKTLIQAKQVATLSTLHQRSGTLKPLKCCVAGKCWK